MIISITIIALLTTFVISYATAKKLRKIHIQKHVLINGTLDEVFDHVLLLEKFPDWSPFVEADPTQDIEIKGIDGQVGAQYHWIGNAGKDVGYQEIKAIRPLEYIKMGCDIQKPFVAKPVFEYHFEQVGSKIKVTQDFYLESGSVDALFMWLFSAKKGMEKMNQRGLELLKMVVEK